MKTDATPASLQLREAISANIAQVHVILERYGARNPRVFGPVARGDATSASDVDLRHQRCHRTMLELPGTYGITGRNNGVDGLWTQSCATLP